MKRNKTLYLFIILFISLIGCGVFTKSYTRKAVDFSAGETGKEDTVKKDGEDKTTADNTVNKDSRDESAVIDTKTAAGKDEKPVKPAQADSKQLTGLAEYMDEQITDESGTEQGIKLEGKSFDVDLFKETPVKKPELPVADWLDAEIKTLVFAGFDEPEKTIAELFKQGKYEKLEELILKTSLPDIQKQYILGEIEFANKEYSKAAGYYDAVLSTGAESDFSEYAAFRKAECLYNTGKFEEAYNLFNKIVCRNYSLIPEVEFSKAQCYIKTGESEKALGIMEQLISNYEGYHLSGRFNYCIGLILYHQKRNSEALDFFSKVDTPQALFYSAKCLESDGRFLPAISIFKDIIKKHRKSGLADDAMYNLGMVFYKMKEYVPAAASFINLLDAYPKNPYAPYARLMLGLCRFDMGYYEIAIKNCDFFFRDYPKGTEPEVHIRRLLAKSYAKLRRYKSVAEEYKKIIAEYPGTQTGIYSACDLALLYYRTGNYDDAVKYCDISEKMAKGKIPEKDILLLKGMCFYRKADMPAAQEQFQGIINSVPDIEVRNKALFMLGLTYMTGEKNEALVTGYFDLADNEELFSGEWRAWAYYFIANAYYNLEKFTNARKTLEYILQNYAGSQAAKYAKNIAVACAVLNNDYNEAELINQEFLNSYGDDEDAKRTSLLISAGIYFNKENYEKAISVYEDFTKNYPRDGNIYEALFMKGESFYRLGHYSKAVDCWEKIAKIKTDSEYFKKALERLAYTNFGLGKYGSTILYYRKIIQYFSGTDLAREAELHIAQCYYNDGKYGQAINEYKKFLGNHPEYEKKEEILENIRMVYYERGTEKSGNDSGLLEFIKLYPEGNMAGEAYWQLGTRIYGRGKYKEAAEIFRKIISDYPQIESSKQALYYLAECLYALKKNSDAVNVFENFIKSFPDDPLSAVAEFHMANALFGMGKIEESLEHYSNIINNNPDAEFAPNAVLNKAFGYKKMNNWEEAAGEYKLFLEKYPGHEKKGYAILQIAEINRNTGNYKEATVYYRQVPPIGEAGPPVEEISKSELLYLTADCYEKAGDIDNAKKYYSELVNLKTEEKTFHLAGLVKLAEFYTEEGKNKEAVDAYKKIMKNTENEEWIAAAEAKIIEIEGKMKGKE